MKGQSTTTSSFGTWDAAHSEAGTATSDEVQKTGILIEDIKMGHRDAIASVYDRYQGKLRNLAYRLLGDESSAEDLVHDVFVTLPSAIQKFKGQSTLSTFLCGILINHARRAIRSATRKRHALSKLSKQIPLPSHSPESQAYETEFLDHMQCLLDRLPIRQRIVFVLVEVEQKSTGEVAEILNTHPATVRTRLFHAKRKLRSYLEKEVL
ncbi:MAG: RNA polymerase sigma factor [Myxococcales bacterium]|nr:MAG: RNA polymerase sigma factor [Myxococcales bacterium]